MEGNVVEECEVSTKLLEKNFVKEILKSFLGKQEQMPPMYSAIKVKGKKLYEYARKGIQVEIKPRQIEIYAIELASIDKEKKQIEFTVSCSKGTYIRSLCEDIANKLGTIGFMKKLERKQVGDFTLEQAVTLEELEQDANLSKSFITVEKLFEKSEKIDLQESKYRHFLNGVKLTQKNKKDGVYRIYYDRKFIGTGIVKNELLKRDIVL